MIKTIVRLLTLASVLAVFVLQIGPLCVPQSQAYAYTISGCIGGVSSNLLFNQQIKITRVPTIGAEQLVSPPTYTTSTGAFSCSGLSSGNYKITPPTINGYTVPAPVTVSIIVSNVIAKPFLYVPLQTFTIMGTVVTVPLGGARVTDGTRSAISSGNGSYYITGVPVGTYTVSASKKGWTFTPSYRTVSIKTANSTGNDFVGRQ